MPELAIDNLADAPSGEGRSVAVLMSGGVDSSLAAAILLQRGWTVRGVTMRLPAPGADAAVQDAATVAQALGVPHDVLDVREEFSHDVIGAFRTAYAAGRTPNPCVDCNRAIKFGLVLDLIEQRFGVSFAATGHYAKILREPDGRACLARGADPNRDQSYFLYPIPADRLPRLLFPLGGLTKDAARAAARASGLPVAERPDSMELCFAGGDDYRTALGALAMPRPGPIRDRSGRVLGEHRGIAHYTLGQRHGLGVAWTEPLYVIGIYVAENALLVGTRAEAYRTLVRTNRPNVLIPELCATDTRCFAKIRSGGEPRPCRIVEVGEHLAAEFDAPVFSPTPGQHLALYDAAGRVIAGGEIAEDERLQRDRI